MKCPSESDEPETCYAIDMVDQLVKEQSCEDYGKSFKNYLDYLSELQEKKIAQEKVLATEAKSDPLEDLTHGPHASHTVRAPQSEKLKIAHGAHKAHTGAVHGPNSSHTNRVPAQTEQPPPELKPFPANLRFLEDFKALQMVIWNTILKAKQIVIGDLIEKFTGTERATCRASRTSVSSHGPYRYHPGRADQHTARAPQKLILLPDPPDPHSAYR